MVPAIPAKGAGAVLLALHTPLAKKRSTVRRMPSRIYFANGKDIEVNDEPIQLYSGLNEKRGLPVRFDVRSGDGTKTGYVNRSRWRTGSRPVGRGERGIRRRPADLEGEVLWRAPRGHPAAVKAPTARRRRASGRAP